jgi:hypothetical protein
MFVRTGIGKWLVPFFTYRRWDTLAKMLDMVA